MAQKRAEFLPIGEIRADFLRQKQITFTDTVSYRE